MKTRPTIKDIAAMVGVSHTTVSYIMSGNTTQKISEETRQAVLEAARKLQYVPNGAARSLRKNRTNCISVAMEKAVTQTRYGGLLQGIRNELRQEGYWLMLFDFDSSDGLYPDYLNSVLQRRTDGLIYVSSDGNPPDEEWRKIVQANSLPFVACDCCPPEDDLASVSFDYERGAFEVACRLFGEGAKRVLYWRPNVNSWQEKYREEGLRRAALLYPNVELVISEIPYQEVDDSFARERNVQFNHVCSQYLAQDIIPRIASFEAGDAVICSWDIMVKHLASMLKEQGRQIKLATLSDSEITGMMGMRVLTSRPGFLRGGEESTRLLLEQLKDGGENRKVIIAPETPAYVEY